MKTVVITGASSGLGAALAHSFSKHGYKLIVIGRNEARLTELARRLDADWMKADVEQEYETLVERIEQTFGPFDVFVNNAGMAEFDAVVDQDVRVIQETMTVNTLAPMVLSRASARTMRPGATIINVCSQAGRVPTPKSAVYAASKAALLQFSNALRLELKPKGIHVMTVNPGPIATPFFDRADKSGRYASSVRGIMLNPDRLADRVVRAFKRREREVNAPRWMQLGSVLYAIWPSGFERLAKKGFDKK